MSILDYAKAGFTTELLPVLPPDALLTGHSTVALDDRGKVPGRWHPAEGRWSGFPNWPRQQPDHAKVALWCRWPTRNIGLQGRLYPAVDIDTETEEIVREATRAALRLIGLAPIRGRAGSRRRLLVFRVPEGAARLGSARIAWHMEGDAKEHAIELLGHGRQYLVAGTHPSGAAYEWQSGKTLLDFGPAGLAPLDLAAWQRLKSEIEGIVVLAGGVLVEHGPSGAMPGDGKPVRIGAQALAAEHFPLLAAAVKAIPNETISDYETWINTLRMIKSACGGDEGFFLEAVLPWCLRWPDNTEEVARAKWESFHDAIAGPDQLFALARRFGFHGGAPEFDTVAEPEAEAPDEDGKGAPLPKRLADIDLAELFVGHNTGRIAYLAPLKRWLLWNGQCWHPDTRGAVRGEVAAFLHGLARRYYDKGGAKNDAIGQKLASNMRAGAVTTLLEHHPGITRDPMLFDRQPMLLNTPAGTVDLATGRLRPAAQADLLTQVTGTAPAATPTPVWDRFLDQVTLGRRDLRDYLQRLAGYCLTGRVHEEMLAFLLGIGGSGKGTFVDTLGRALGSYAHWAPLNLLSEARGERHPAGVAGLAGKRLVIIDETSKGRHWDEQLIKALTGRSKVTARFMGKDFFTYEPEFKLVITGNHKPHLSSTGEDITRRFQLVPFDYKPPERDGSLKDRIWAELPGILQWAIEGCLLWQIFGLEPPPEITGKTGEYVLEEDALQRWLDERVLADASVKRVMTQSLYEDFRQWCGAEGESHIPSKQVFSMDLVKKGHKRVLEPKTKRSAFVALRLRNPEGFDVLDGGLSEQKEPD